MFQDHPPSLGGSTYESPSLTISSHLRVLHDQVGKVSIPRHICVSSKSSARGALSYCETVKDLAKMQNEEGQNMDLYIPRKCSATNRLITSKDHASVQINVGHLGPDGVYTNQFTTFALCGYIRAQGDADSAIDRLWQKKKAEIKQ
ncbi:hypothetical protein SAY86_027897 [Trapa natans]|uniref:40S ribosomal protein S21 n=2 Tax=Trapa TaxID=22665 RepID=A0AAN7RCQ8_TRANT|nr:hypothetical protein SAY86_027897 [Trapa natans]